ncbi:PRCC protein, partial [Copsychus sechellarum]|nr:PRCC protein [Copsychus sechellarum]
MSLVAYASSEEDSDAEEPAGEEEEAADSPPAAAEQPSSRGLFAALPPPRAPAVPPSFLTGPPPTVSGFGSAPPGRAGAESPPEPAASGDGAAESPRPRGLLLPPPRNAATAASPLSPPPAASPGAGLGLPKPKKRTEPVRIAAPELHKGDSDSEEDEPAKKKNTLQGRSEGSGLSALLPQPKNMTVKETNRLLLPYSFSRKAGGENTSDSKPAKPPSSSSKAKPATKPAVPTTPSPSAIKAAAKSAALQVTKQITQEEEDSDEEVQPENYFSLSDRSEPSAQPFLYSSEEAPPGTEPQPQLQDAAANAPLEFRTGVGSSWAPKPGEDYSSHGYSQFSPAYSEPGGYYQVSSLVRGEVRLWAGKHLSRLNTSPLSAFQKKGDQPTGQQRRKHQITYLIHQAKERELELKNTWSENKLSRRQTQAKYGF